MHNEWNIELSFEEDGTTTACDARLVGVRAPALNAHAESVRSAADRPTDRIGEEVAASRALDMLARKLHAQADGDIEDASMRPAYLIY
ncbi:hypothetical protein P3T37_000626 [Kitasatospora sp. MAA4]|uniref:dsRBD fold-containing protein n=1 Tax=Kitasatospora sp. MAA4 TaxID=3035093 RepID=UPI00247712E0|nr:dsRBD fold-containing protein [Kitasatospora sp. MAA4]MDH6131257.1 hypothetical protein [Kitasatospora sp. MAA4]